MRRAGDKAAWTAAGLLTVAMVGQGCSAAGEGTAQPAESRATQSAALTAAAIGSPLVPLNNSASGPLQMGPTHAYSIPMAPSTVCTIHPEGVTGDASRSAQLIARQDGKIRFDFAPTAAAAWGTKVTLDCGPASAPQSVLVDLNDSSTFRTESVADLQPVKTGVQTALTGDLSALSNNELAKAGYPMRPDVGSSLYAQWVKIVTHDIDMYRAVPVTILGLQNTGPFVEGYTQRDFGWSGFVQAAGGFHLGSGSYPYVAVPATLYTAYQAFTFAPIPNGCWGGATCDESSIWAGTGGARVWASSTRQFAPALLQSGFQIMNGGVTLELMAEFWPGNPNVFLPANTIYANDEFFIEGYDGDGSCNPTTGVPTNGCFLYYDTTEGYWGVNDIEMFPSSGLWYPGSMEYVTEFHPGSGNNDNYGGDEMVGGGMDTAGTWHYDPASSTATDPYVEVDSLDSTGNQCAIVEWDNGTINTPVDPMFFFPEPCGPN